MKQVYVSRTLLSFLFLLFAGAAFASGHVVNTTSLVNVSCHGGSNGSATVSVSGGVGPFTYQWLPSGGTNPTITGAVAGSYTCAVTDQSDMSVSSGTVTINQPPQLNASISGMPIQCNGGNTTLSVMASGGIPPYTYTWAPMMNTTQSVTVPAGSYTVTVTDSNGCTATGTITLVNPPPVVINISPASFPNVCAGNTITLTASGANVYTWVPGNIAGASITVAPMNSTTYTVTGTNASGCVGTQTVMVVVNQNPTVTLTSTNNSCFSSCNGSITTSVTGGSAPYSYIWSNATTTQNQNNLCVGAYTVTVTDANGCSTANAVSITQPTAITLTPSALVPAGCNASDGSVSVMALGGTPAYTYAWTPSGNTSANNTMIASGTHAVTVTDANNCSASLSIIVGDSCDYVWPGDANDDAVADNTDILDIGIANGATGTTRANASLTWIGQPSTAWGQTLASGTDYKWVDCDGNGTIDPQDTNAVVQNFGLTHNNRLHANPPYNASLPDLTVTMGQGIIGAGASGTLNISLGTSSMQASNVYGIAFTLNFDPAQIDAASFHMNENGSWMGTPGSDLMGVVLTPLNGGSVQVALTRLDHNNAAGFGNIANMAFTTTSALYGTGNTQNVNFTISNVTVISANETPQQVNAVGDSTIISDPLILGVTEPNAVQTIAAVPNPFSASVQLALPAECSGKTCEVTLTDAMGRVVSTQFTNGETTAVLQRGNLEAGVYFCTVRSEGRVVGGTKLVVK